MTFIHSIAKARKQFVGSRLVAARLGFALVAGMLSTQAFPIAAARAATPSPAPMLLAQRPNQRIAVLQCGAYTISIAYVGQTGSDTFSYRTRGLFLRNGRLGPNPENPRTPENTYVFNNSDYEYRVNVFTQNSNDTSGTGKLQVLHYGEPVLTKQCTWSN